MSVSDRALAFDNRKKHEAACRELQRLLPNFASIRLAIGEQLLIIHDAEVWKETHKTLKAFFLETFGLDRSYAYRLMDAAKVTKNLNLSPIGDNAEVPKLESQLREVAKAPAELQAEVVRKAVEKAAEENRKPTASDFKKVVGELLDEREQLPQGESDPVGVDDESEEEDDYPDPRQMAAPLMAHVKTLTQMLNSLKKLREEHGGQWIDVQSIGTQITELKHNIKSSIYYADCPSCNGKGCDRCRQSGFLPELKKDSVKC